MTRAATFSHYVRLPHCRPYNYLKVVVGSKRYLQHNIMAQTNLDL